MSTAPSDQSNRLLAALARPIWLVALVIVVSDLKKDPFMRHHGWTALFWGIAWFALWVVVTILSGIPFVGFLMGVLTFPVLWLAWLILSVYYAVQTYQGRAFTIPLVSDWAKKYTT